MALNAHYTALLYCITFFTTSVMLKPILLPLRGNMVKAKQAAVCHHKAFKVLFFDPPRKELIGIVYRF